MLLLASMSLWEEEKRVEQKGQILPSSLRSEGKKNASDKCATETAKFDI